MKNTVLKSLILVFVFTLSACVKQAQSPSEFMELSKTTNSINVSSTTINDKFSRIAPRLKTKVNDCYNYDIIESSGFGSRVVTKYRVRTSKQAKGLLEISIQNEFIGPRSGPEMPSGGFYSTVVTLKKVSRNKSELKVYYPSWGFSDKEIIAWAMGKKATCPIH